MEIYKNIEGYEGYQISNYGRVKSLGNYKTRKEKILKPAKLKSGYLTVVLSKNNKRKLHYVHRLVAQAFIPNSNNLPEINHRDEDKTNNCVSNLEWCTREYNINYGTRNQMVAEKTSKQVLCLETGVVYSSAREIERQLGFYNSGVSAVCLGKCKTYKGFHWCYVS